MDELTNRVHALPPELFNEIYTFTFTLSKNEYYIDRDSSPPSCLQVQRESRKQLAKSYHSNGSIFYVKKKDCVRWLKHLSEIRWDLAENVEIRILDLSVRRVNGQAVMRPDSIYWFTTMGIRSIEGIADCPGKRGGALPNVKILAIDEVEGWTRWINEQDAYDLHRSNEVKGREWTF